MARQFQGRLERIDANRWRIPKDCREDMRVDGVIYAGDELIEE